MSAAPGAPRSGASAQAARNPSGREPQRALELLAEQLAAEDSVLSPHVREAAEDPALGMLAAAGPRAARSRGDYSLLIEAVREGYLLHYGRPRVVAGAEPDLRLLAGDYLYALGLRRLAALGDLEAVRELSDLISLSAQLHAGDPPPSPAAEASAGRPPAAASQASLGGRPQTPPAAASALWLAVTVAVAAGTSERHERAKAALREGADDAAHLVLCEARHRAARTGLSGELERAGEAVGLDLSQLPERG